VTLITNANSNDDPRYAIVSSITSLPLAQTHFPQNRSLGYPLQQMTNFHTYTKQRAE
jgi:hypothetical protein